MTFDDEFNSLSATRTSPKGSSTWYAGPANGATGDFSESNWNINALSVSNGILTDEAYYASPAVNGQNWQSGELTSVDPTVAGFSQQYGYFEIRCQMPNAGEGAWPAFWLDTTSGITGGQNEEIDIFEWYGVTNTPGNDQDLIQQASHNWNANGTQNQTLPYLYSPQTAMPDGEYPWQGYHIYGCQIDPVHVTWYIDGVQTNQIATPSSYITSPFFMILDYALGGGWALSGTPFTTDGTSSLLVDWVRVYALPTLTVANGTGTGSYAPGTVVSVTANSAPSGYQFAGWELGYGSTGTLGNASSATTTLTMGSGATVLTASYTPVGGTSYTLTVNGGSGSGNYPPGTVVTVSAYAAPGGQQFARWLGTTSALLLSDADSSTTTISMPSTPTTITASYGAIPTTYPVTVNSGTGGGSYAAGTVLTVTANAAPTGSYFTGWTGSTSALANASFSSTKLTVPVPGATITANYATGTSTYALTVNSGTGSGTYAPGTAVTVTAGAPPNGMQFAGWTGATTQLSNHSAPCTSFNTSTAPASITATYSAISSTASLVLAVGLEKIVAGYDGPLIRIQRPSDNTQEDIYAASGSNLLDTSAVSAFLGQSQGWITTLYAQDGSGHNCTTPLPTSTSTMPTISAIDPTSITVNGSPSLTARNVEQPYQYEQGNFRYFVVPPSVSVSKSQASAFLAFRADYSGGPYMSLFEIGHNPNPVPSTSAPIDLVDLISTNSGLEGLSHITYQNLNGANDNGVLTTTFGQNSIVTRCQPTVVGLVSYPTSAPLIYLDGVSRLANLTNTAPAAANCAGGYLLAGNGTGNLYEQPLYGQYNFLAFELYSGSVTSTAAATISSTMLPRGTIPSVNIVASGDSITQGTGTVYSYNMLRDLESLLNSPADITNLAVYGTTSYTALSDTTYTEPNATAPTAKLLYSSNYKTNIYYVDIGTNDIHNGGVGSGAAAWNVVQQSLTAAKAMGYKTIVATLLHEYGESSTAATEINSFDTLARAAVGQPYLDGLVDYEADVRLGNTGIYYPAYSGDGTHPNDLGNEVMSSISAPVFNSIIGTTPTPATLVSAVSRQVQGTAGTFNLPLSLTSTPTIECRRGATIGSYSLVMTFSQPVTSLSATLGLQAGQTGTAVGTAQTPSISGSTVTVNLTGVANAQCLNLQLTNIQPGSGTASVPLNVLWGNVKATGVVSSADYLVTRSEEGALLNSTNFQYDVNCDGIISSGDALLVRSLSGTFLP